MTRLGRAISWLHGWLSARVRLRLLRLFRLPLRDLTRYERKMSPRNRGEYAQSGEDGVLEAIFALIGPTNRHYVEFGTQDGIQCNTRWLMKHRGWSGLLMDGSHENPSIGLAREFVTAGNVEELFRKYGVPAEFDLLSIDIDGNDYWVWRAIRSYRPRVVVIEYNASLPCEPAVTAGHGRTNRRFG